MGCHTWCFRPATQEEKNQIKIEKLRFIMEEYHLWDCCVSERFGDIPFSQIEYLFHKNEIPKDVSSYKYNELIRNKIYEEYFLESIGNAKANWERMKNYPADALDPQTLESNNLFAKSINYKDYNEMYEDTKRLASITFEEYCRDNRISYANKLTKWDIENPKVWTDKDIVIENEYYNLHDGGLMCVHNGIFYTDKDTPHDIFRVYQYDFPRQYNAEDCITNVNAYKDSVGQPRLDESEIESIHSFFNEYKGGYIEFG